MSDDKDDKPPLPNHYGHGSDDLALLPRRFDFFASEMRSSLLELREKIIPLLERIQFAIEDIAERVSRLEKKQHETDDRLNALEAARAKRKLGSKSRRLKVVKGGS